MSSVQERLQQLLDGELDPSELAADPTLVSLADRLYGSKIAAVQPVKARDAQDLLAGTAPVTEVAPPTDMLVEVIGSVGAPAGVAPVPLPVPEVQLDLPPVPSAQKSPLRFVFLGGLLFVIATGLFYVFRQIVNPEAVVEALNAGDLAAGLGAPSTTTVAFSGALLLVYTLWALLVLTQGAEGMWPIAHPPLFAFVAVAIANYFAFVFGPVREFTEQNEMDAIAGPMTLLVFLVVYLRLRKEGIEEGMTFAGEPTDSAGFDVMFTGVVVVVSALYFLTNML